MGDCSTGNAWRSVQPASPDSNDTLYGIDVISKTLGYAVGGNPYNIDTYIFTGTNWTEFYPDIQQDFSRLYYSTDILESSGIPWFGGIGDRPFPQCLGLEARLGYLTKDIYNQDVVTETNILPNRDPNCPSKVYHRPVFKMDMLTESMGWAVGDGEDPKNLSVTYLWPYPNYTLISDPETNSVLPGDTANYTITVSSIGNIGPNVSFTVTNLPPYSSATPLSGVLAGKQPIAIHTSPSTPYGDYLINFNASATYKSLNKDITVNRTLQIKLRVTNNFVTAVVPDHDRAGNVVDIFGKFFGPDPGQGQRSTDQHHVVLAGKQMPDNNVISWSDTLIKVVVPDNQNLFPRGPDIGEVSITRNGIESNDNLTFQLENYIDDLSLQQLGGNLLITLSGTSFGQDPKILLVGGSRSTATEHVSFNGEWIEDIDVLDWSNNSISFLVPGFPMSGAISVTSNGYQSNVVDLIGIWPKIYFPAVSR
jgi:hypothetical protein